MFIDHGHHFGNDPAVPDFDRERGDVGVAWNLDRRTLSSCRHLSASFLSIRILVGGDAEFYRQVPEL
jgi:hypothetical protein